MKRLLLLKERLLEGLPFAVLLLLSFAFPLVFASELRQGLVLPKNILLYAGVATTLFMWLLRAVLQKRLHVRKSVIDVPLLLFVGFVLLSSLVRNNIGLSIFGFADEYVIHAASLLMGALLVWLLIQEIRTQFRWELLLQTVLAAGAIASALFIGSSYGIISLPVLNTVSAITSVFGVAIVSLLALSLGLLLLRETSKPLIIMAGISSFLAVWSLLRIDFTLLWGLTITMALLLFFVTWVQRKHIRQWGWVGLVALVVISGYALWRGIPVSLSVQSSLPAEVTLSAGVSWDIASSAALEGPGVLFFGNGPASFSSIFSLYRPSEFNLNPFIAQLRFRQPYNTALGMVSSVGLLGGVSFATLILMMLGVVASTMKQLPSSGLKKLLSRKRRHDVIGLQGMYVAVAWAIITIAMFFVYIDAAVWMLWWWCIGMTFVGVSVLSPRLVREKERNIKLSDGGQLLVSFIIVGIFVSGAIVAVFSARQIQAERVYTKATGESNVLLAQQYVQDAMVLRPGYPEYRIAQARLSLEIARQESEKENPQEAIIVNGLAAAVNDMKLLSEQYPENVAVWETLALLYMNSRIFAAEANDWALQATEQALALEPTNAGLYVQAGNAHEHAKRYQDARRAYQQAIELKESDINAYLQLAALLEKTGELNAAVAMYDRALRVQPDNVSARYHSGRILFNRGEEGDYDLAEQLWTDAIRLNPRHVNSLYSLGLLYEQQREWQKARNVYQHIITIDENNDAAAARLDALR